MHITAALVAEGDQPAKVAIPPAAIAAIIMVIFVRLVVGNKRTITGPKSV
jgi:hypothetical protein